MHAAATRQLKSEFILEIKKRKVSDEFEYFETSGGYMQDRIRAFELHSRISISDRVLHVKSAEVCDSSGGEDLSAVEPFG